MLYAWKSHNRLNQLHQTLLKQYEFSKNILVKHFSRPGSRIFASFIAEPHPRASLQLARPLALSQLAPCIHRPPFLISFRLSPTVAQSYALIAAPYASCALQSGHW